MCRAHEGSTLLNIEIYWLYFGISKFGKIECLLTVYKKVYKNTDYDDNDDYEDGGDDGDDDNSGRCDARYEKQWDFK